MVKVFFIPINTTGNMEDISSSSPFTNSNSIEEKHLQSFLKDIRVDNISHFIIGQLDIDPLRNNLSNYPQ